MTTEEIIFNLQCIAETSKYSNTIVTACKNAVELLTRIVRLKDIVDEMEEPEEDYQFGYIDGLQKALEILGGKTIKLVVEVPEKLVYDAFENHLNEHEKDILIKAIGNGIPFHLYDTLTEKELNND